MLSFHFQYWVLASDHCFHSRCKVCTWKRSVHDVNKGGRSLWPTSITLDFALAHDGLGKELIEVDKGTDSNHLLIIRCQALFRGTTNKTWLKGNRRKYTLLYNTNNLRSIKSTIAYHHRCNLHHHQRRYQFPLCLFRYPKFNNQF